MRMISIDSGKDRIIFAIDTGERLADALRWVDLLKDHVGLFKVGKESFTHFGPAILREITARGGNVFLDLKFHDIPNTVARAAEAAVRWDVAMFNVHAGGGREMMRQAVSAVRAAAGKRRPRRLLSWPSRFSPASPTAIFGTWDTGKRRTVLPSGSPSWPVKRASTAWSARPGRLPPSAGPAGPISRS